MSKVGRNTAVVVTVAALAAVGLGGGVGWVVASRSGPAEKAEPPVACDQPRPTDPPAYAGLCAALNRPDLPALMGTPEDRVTAARPAPFALGDPTVEVRLGRSVVVLTDSSVTVEDLADMSQFFPAPATLLGHPATIYSTHAMTFGAGADGKVSTGSGPRTRNLAVAKDPKAPGGRAYEIAVFTTDGTPVDEQALYQLAETVLPTLPGWAAAAAS
ncbi:DUF6215 domain-containing protein [Kitasatospora sp. NPDC094015]|uniref:DUF6215 domain-containing protein n=1 Tax=Kitasatospora sp. NPDC094015 TaxID=3155205 RepID=UPI0033321949